MSALQISKAEVLDRIDRLKKKIWLRRPVLGEILSSHGNDTLFDYSIDFLDVNPSPRLDARKHEVVNVVNQILAERLGKNVADDVCEQLSKLPLVSTADHHGPITHPFFVNSNIISGLPYGGNNACRYLIDFAFSSISINNASLPRGIAFHANDDGSGDLIRLTFFPDKLKMGAVYGMRAYTKEDFERAKHELLKKNMDEERKKRIAAILDTFFGTDDIFNAPDFNTQVTMINYRLWPHLFHSGEVGGEFSTVATPGLIYVEVESIVARLLTSIHFNNENSIFYKILFDKNYQELALRHFNNLPGSFSLEKKWGTYFFWGIDKNYHRERLVLDGDCIMPHDGTYKIKLTPAELSACLREKKIFPSMALCYMVISLYYGFKCLGGFSQVHDLTVLKEAWAVFLKEINEVAEVDAIHSVQTKELGGDGLVLSYLKQKTDETLVPATAIDMMLRRQSTTMDKYVALSKRVTLAEAINPMLPEIYAVLYSQEDRDPELAALDSKIILWATDFSEKIADPAVSTAPALQHIFS